ncbi:hypothetical protein [Prochlorothrix hollandica]|uniref:hypothetical protein n=1 Tax=Prochlorothrix hollandica TaxID=1223 RepID=UPI00333E5E6B
MAKHNQAHLPRRIPKSQGGLPISIKEQMEYYMGAKLLEVGVNPKEPFFSWSCEEEGDEQVWTYSAYWGELKEEKLREKAAKQAAKAQATGKAAIASVSAPEPPQAENPEPPKRKFWNLFG